jgi:CRISPR-associated endonuclease/helicase Cas3
MSDWEPLDAHLEKVAVLAGEFCAAFGAREWGETLGRLHDLGKLSPEFQDYLRNSADVDAGEEQVQRPGRVDHSTFGARCAIEHAGPHAGQLLAYCIAGHHAGLPDWIAEHAENDRSSLRYRLSAANKRPPAMDHKRMSPGIPPLRFPFPPASDAVGFQLAFFTRMIFSALIDADRLATEAFCDPAQAQHRRVSYPDILELTRRVSESIDRLTGNAGKTPVNAVRADVLAQCRAAAKDPPGFFSLNVPTGGGKTLSSMDFALRHASVHGLRRILFAVPFTTILEQTADVYRSAFGEDAGACLIEHHSNLEPTKDTRENKLATENWDAPVILTTNVQLFESLFAAGTTPCRKLHRIAGSVIVLDEVQTIPVEFLQPTLRVLRELVEHYGCSVVLCTATQPALEKEDSFAIGLGNVRPIIQDAPKLFQVLKRVEVGHAGKLADTELAARMAEERSVLCIVNTRAHAAALYEALRLAEPEGVFHLSTNMCAAHRRLVLAEIRKRLKNGKACRLVSTQLVEAGVDLDFDVVYRAPAGFDSVAQAAGRCNREGRRERGRVWLFETEELPPPGLLRQSAQVGRELSAKYGDPLAPEAVREYFRMLYWLNESRWDAREVMACFRATPQERELAFQFRSAAERYRLIDDVQVQVLVVYDATSRNLRDRMLLGDAGGFIDYRLAQRYLVGVYEQVKFALWKSGAIEEHKAGSGLWLLVNERVYNEEKGLSLSDARYTAEECVV